MKILRLARCLSAAGMMSAAFLPTAAFAQSQSAGFALSRFEPAEHGSRWFELDSLDFGANRKVSLGLVGDYAYKPLVIYNSDGSEKLVVARHQFITHVGGALTLFDRLRLGADLPVVFYAAGSSGQLGLTTFSAPVGGTIGDLRLAADVRLLGTPGGAFSLAAGLRANLPTGDATSYAGDGKFRVSPQVMAAGASGRFHWAARAGYTWRQNEVKLPSNTIGSELNLAASAGFTFMDNKLLVGPEFFTTTRASMDELFKETSTPVELMLGAHYDCPNWRTGLGIAKGLNHGVGEPAFRVVASIAWVPSEGAPVDSDGDGIIDAQDACPTVAGVASADASKNGCPADSDGDGIPDAQDACPSVKGVKSDDAAKNGCPADSDGDGIPDAQDACPTVKGLANSDAKLNGCPAQDSDGDGIVDSEDACPTVKGVKSADPKANGCPADADKDGIPDSEDACVNEPGTPSADKRFHGCPEKKDVDNDEVPDREDACLKEPGKRNADPKKNGCPVGAVINGELVLDQVKFKTDSDIILKESDDTLNKVLEAINKLPATNRYRIEGHTDSQGKPAYNKGLSERRAKSVVAWLAKHGLDAKRFEAKGFGQEKPIASNDTDEGRQANRRVEIHILEGTNQLPAQPAPAK